MVPLTAADLKSKIERKDEDAPRKLAQAESAARHQSQASRLPGLEL